MIISVALYVVSSRVGIVKRGIDRFWLYYSVHQAAKLDAECVDYVGITEQAVFSYNENNKADPESLLVQSLARTAVAARPPGLQKYFMYDATAKLALHYILNEVKMRGMQTPLLQPLFDSQNRPVATRNSAASPEICVFVISARRYSSVFSFLVQTVTGLVTRMQPDDFSSFTAHVFNVDRFPDSHEELQLLQPLLSTSSLKTDKLQYPANRLMAGGEIDVSTSPPTANESSFYETMDFAQAMRAVAQLKDDCCQFPIFLEDDALADERWTLKVREALALLQQQETPDSWLTLKLFVARETYPEMNGPAISDYDGRCNTVALLMNRKYLLALAGFLEEKILQGVQRPKDLLIHDFAKQRDLKVLSYEPVAFQHVGIVSSRETRHVSVLDGGKWAMASKLFESENAPVIFRPNF